MNDPQTPEGPAHASAEDAQSALFAQLVLQQSNLAMMLLGKVSHPETGKVVKDIETARLFIDTVEMLEAKTKGNLSREESALLKQSLMNLRLAFVEAVESPAAPAQPAPQPQSPPTPGAEPKPADSGPEEEHRTKFSKKY